MPDNNNYRVGEPGPSGSVIKQIIIQGVEFIVYIDSNVDIEWSTEETYVDFHPQFGSIQNRVSYWESIGKQVPEKVGLTLFNFHRKSTFTYILKRRALALKPGKYLVRDFLTGQVIGEMEEDQSEMALSVQPKDGAMLEKVH
jgi:hypothetical protein